MVQKNQMVTDGPINTKLLIFTKFSSFYQNKRTEKMHFEAV